MDRAQFKTGFPLISMETFSLCLSPGCNRPGQTNKKGFCHACYQAQWRASNPLLALFHTHKANAKRRGVPVLWEFPDFVEWAIQWDYEEKHSRGFEIHRVDNLKGYFADNCRPISEFENRSLGGGIERLRKQHAKRRGIRYENV